MPPNWAACVSSASLKQFEGDQVGQVVHLRERFKVNTPDLDWIQQLSKERNWTIISGDAFRKNNGAERKILRNSGLSVFVLQSSWASHPYWDKTAQLLRWWPRIVAQANSVDSIAMEVPWRLAGRFRQL